eukprot:m.15580 g.15580  ORF g.15580 m.15580 type:complete len:411 (-) comp10650_c0_seq1:204-1436(-)
MAILDAFFRTIVLTICVFGFSIRLIDLLPTPIGRNPFFVVYIVGMVVLVRMGLRGRLWAPVIAFAITKGYADNTLVPPPPTTFCKQAPCVVLVTGGNGGIGFGVAKIMASQGHHVILGCRSKTKCDVARDTISAFSPSPELVVSAPGLELGSLSAVQNWVDSVQFPIAGVDLLVHNAGHAPVGNSTTSEGFEEGFGSMHLGHAALFRLLKSKAKLVDDVTLIQVSSYAMMFGSFDTSLGVGDGTGDLHGEKTIGCFSPFPICYPKSDPEQFEPPAIFPGLSPGSYCRAKYANFLYAREAHKRYKGIRSASVHPGVVFTAFATDVCEVLFPEASVVLESLNTGLMFLTLRPAESAALVVLRAAEQVRNNENINGAHFSGMGVATSDIPPNADRVAERLWDVTEAILDQHLF